MSKCYCVRIEFKDPEAVMYKNIAATEYPEFLKTYPEEALSKGLEVSEIKVVKQYEEDMDGN